MTRTKVVKFFTPEFDNFGSCLAMMSEVKLVYQSTIQARLTSKLQKGGEYISLLNCTIVGKGCIYKIKSILQILEE